MALREDATAFAREWMAALDRAYVSMNTDELSRLSDAACRTCANYIAALDASRAAGRKWMGGMHEVKAATAAPPEGGLVDVLVDFRTDAAYVLEPDGSRTNDQAPLTATFEIRVERRDSRLVATKVSRL